MRGRQEIQGFLILRISGGGIPTANSQVPTATTSSFPPQKSGKQAFSDFLPLPQAGGVYSSNKINMRIPLKLSLYIIRLFVTNLLIVFAVIAALILLVDGLEIVRKAQDSDISIFMIIQMTILKFPLAGQKIMPFLMLFATIFTYTKLSHTQELVIIRAAGVSVWEFLFPAVITAFTIGVLMVMLLNPLSTSMLSRYESLETKYLEGRSSFLEISSSGLWLRQRNVIYASDPNNRGEVIIHAQDIGKGRGSDIDLHDVTIFIFATQDSFSRRIDAKEAWLLRDFWHLKDVTLSAPGKTPEHHKEYFLETDLTVKDIHDSFATAETISFWALPSFIATLTKSGFSALPHRLHWHTILASPLFYAAMVMIASLFSLRPSRQGKTGLLITSSIVAGFVIYFLITIVSSLGLSGNMPVAMAAWAPVGVSMLLGLWLLLHFEDG